ncbi:hypothetical protein H072_4967 [Dactylellina haptotyla CBS 200.50]|uniref:Microtubule associated protein n=1 Tax=Dactylellina haptotyla (strain CBS 200.50) TaxID=1284197 RepID=S8BNT6_DACHA|nr:hypothetical protein H072_4967 [Dactylellina haptotyla CBS 200.50]
MQHNLQEMYSGGSGTDEGISSQKAISTSRVEESGFESPNRFVYYARKVYHPIGFRKGYNFSLFVIFAGAMFGFALARLPYLNISGTASSSFFNNILPSELYWYSQFSIYRIGITLHLYAVLPAGLLMVFQFVPAIRYKLLPLHRINGYIIIILVMISNVGALMIARRAFGGGLETQAAVGTMVIMVTTSISLAYYNIKRLQIEQHRKWMLRAMFYLGVIITMRIILLVGSIVVNAQKSYWTVAECKEVEFGYQDPNMFREMYPACVGLNGEIVDGHVAVQGLADGMAEEVAVGFKLSFGMAAWVAIMMHLVGVEVYLALTPRETERLRKISYERQLERGYRDPGRGGLTSDRVGDAVKWSPSGL